jgi:hypothetical protein
MNATFVTTTVCAALVGLLTLSQSALAQQKTTKQCNDEWTAGKAAIQASGKTKRAFVAECRGVTLAAPSPRAPTALAKGQHATEAEARSSCATDAIVWVNLQSKIYHGVGSKSFGTTKQGAYMCEKESVAAGFRAPKNAIRNAKGAAT